MSEKKKLETFIQEHRDEFDPYEAPDRVGRAIEKEFKKSIQPLWGRIALWRAAAVLFMAVSGYLLFDRYTGESQDSVRSQLEEFKEVEAYYTARINEKVQLINHFDQTDGLNGFTQDFQQLEAMYQILLEEMRLKPSKKVREALELNLIIQIDLLNQRLNNLERISKQEEGIANS